MDIFLFFNEVMNKVIRNKVDNFSDFWGLLKLPVGGIIFSRAGKGQQEGWNK